MPQEKPHNFVRFTGGVHVAWKPHVLMVIVVLLLSGEQLWAQWVQTKGPEGGSVQCLAFLRLPSGTGTPYLFAGTPSAGVFRSSDGGMSWATTNSGLTNFGTASLIASDSILYLGTSGSGVFRSTNAGTTWTPFNFRLSSASVSVLMAADTFLYASVTGTGIYRSGRTSSNWQLLRLGPTAPWVRAFATDGRNQENVFRGPSQ